MLHDKLIAENFIRHSKNDHHSHSPQNSSTKKRSDLYHSYGLPENEFQVLDLSKSNEITTRETASPCQNDNLNMSIKISSSTNTGKCDSLSPQPNGKTLAASIQKLYAHHSLISSSTPNLHTNSSQNQLFHNSQGFPIYPMYYPQIKDERELSPESQKQYIKSDHLPAFPQNYHSHANLIHSFNLMKAASFPEHMLTDIKSPPPPTNISPKPSGKLESSDDKLSETGSIPGSPSSSSTHYSIIQKKSSSLLSVDSQQSQGKPTRPFKAYPRDPTVIAANFAATDSLYNHSKVEQYSEYRKRILDQIRSANGGERTISNPKMRRINTRPNCSARSDESNSDQMNNSESEDRNCDSDNDSTAPICVTENDDKSNSDNNNMDEMLNKNNTNSIKDAAYFERRRKNNAAAKKSRDRRRIKEDEIAIRAAYLERQNIELLCQLDALKSQIALMTKNNESRAK